MRIIALDIHRTFAQVVILEHGQLRQAGRVRLSHDKLLSFAKTLTPEDDVVLEATGYSLAVARTLQPFVRRVIITNPLQVRAIAHAQAAGTAAACRPADAEEPGLVVVTSRSALAWSVLHPRGAGGAAGSLRFRERRPAG
ncbi:hypothetical protein [Azospirillum sp.]|uniref:hypothetical protein n=1 Tax=Azospirillum sp. TaxID=34012 RepID=UPI003D73ACDA